MMGHRDDTGSRWITGKTRCSNGSHGGDKVMMGHMKVTGWELITSPSHLPV